MRTPTMTRIVARTGRRTLSDTRALRWLPKKMPGREPMTREPSRPGPANNADRPITALKGTGIRYLTFRNANRSDAHDDAYPVVPGSLILCIVSSRPATCGGREGAPSGPGFVFSIGVIRRRYGNDRYVRSLRGTASLTRVINSGGNGPASAAATHSASSCRFFTPSTRVSISSDRA
jgi:hypothetical protein